MTTEESSIDSWIAAKALAHVAQDEGFDLIFTGKQAVDDDQAQVGSLVATELGIPQVTVVLRLEVDGESRQVKAVRELEGATETVTCALPAVLTAQRGLNEPRYPTLPNIMKAKKKEVKKVGIGISWVGPDPQGAGAGVEYAARTAGGQDFNRGSGRNGPGISALIT